MVADILVSFLSKATIKQTLSWAEWEQYTLLRTLSHETTLLVTETVKNQPTEQDNGEMGKDLNPQI